MNNPTYDPRGMRSRRLPTLDAMSGNRIAACIMWLLGVVATSLLFRTFLVNAPWFVPALAALVMQALLTWFERPVWRGKASSIGIAGLIIDVLLNAGGIYPYARRLGETPMGQMIADVLNSNAIVGPIGATIVSVLVGFLIAAAPEELWNRKD